MRLNKVQALKWLKSHEFIDLCPCKLYPYGPFMPSVRIFKDDIANRCKEFEESFDEVFYNIITHFEYYNCSYEAGYYTHFYTGENI